MTGNEELDSALYKEIIDKYCTPKGGKNSFRSRDRVVARAINWIYDKEASEVPNSLSCETYSFW